MEGLERIIREHPFFAGLSEEFCRPSNRGHDCLTNDEPRHARKAFEIFADDERLCRLLHRPPAHREILMEPRHEQPAARRIP